MRCAKCGREVDPASPECPYCAAGAVYAEPEAPPRVRCPRCGSLELDTVRRDYDPGCGCLGLLLFSWWGLLLGFLGAGDVETVCRNCGLRWKTGHPGSHHSCMFTILLALAAFTVLMFALK